MYVLLLCAYKDGELAFSGQGFEKNFDIVLVL
jgi:hypothetical protein